MEIITRDEATSADLTHYFTGVPCKHGHLSPRYTKNTKCATCVFNTVTRHKAANIEKIAAYRQEYRDSNRERLAAETRAHRFMNSEKVKASKQKWREKPENKRKDYDYANHRRATNPAFKASMRMRDMVRRVLKMTGKKKNGTTREILGYEGQDLRLHLERQFKPGMTWDNYGEWHIDHKIPVSLLLLYGVDDPAIVNALSNLQPMWAHDNMVKGNRSVCQ